MWFIWWCDFQWFSKESKWREFLVLARFEPFQITEIQMLAVVCMFFIFLSKITSASIHLVLIFHSKYSYIAFLFLFSSTLLFHYQYLPVDIGKSNQTDIKRASNSESPMTSYALILILIYWVFSIISEEMYQVNLAEDPFFYPLNWILLNSIRLLKMAGKDTGKVDGIGWT